MSDLEDFMKEYEPKYPLMKYKKEILELIYNGYTREHILIFLRLKKNVNISKSSLNRNIKKFREEEEENSTRVASQKESESIKNETQTNNKDRMSEEEFKRKLEAK